MPIDLERVKAICFDIDGTLNDTDNQFVLKLVRLFSPMGLLIGNQTVHRIARKFVMVTEGPGNWLYNFADRIGWDERIINLGDKIYELGMGESPDPYILIDGSPRDAGEITLFLSSQHHQRAGK